MEPTSQSDDFRLTIDWGEADDHSDDFVAAALNTHSAVRPPEFDEEPEPADDAASMTQVEPAAPFDGDSEDVEPEIPEAESGAAVTVQTARPIPDSEPAESFYEPEPEVPAVSLPATLDGIAVQLASTAVRVESLHGASGRMRATTDARLAAVTAQVADLVDLTADLRIAIRSVTETTARIEAVETAVTALTEQVTTAIDERFAGIEGRQAEADSRLVELFDKTVEAQSELEDRLAEIVATTSAALMAQVSETDERVKANLQAEFELLVSRMRSSVDQAELGLRDAYDAGRREAAMAREEAQVLLSETANELRLVKRRLTLRAKAPVAEVSDEQVAAIVDAVTSAVTTATATTSTAPASPEPATDAAPRRRRR